MLLRRALAASMQRLRQPPRGFGTLARLAAAWAMFITLACYSSFALLSRTNIGPSSITILHGQQRGLRDESCPFSQSQVDDPHDLMDRFVSTHKQHFETALSEIRAGSKSSHWSWFIFPTPLYHQGSALNQHYALRTDEQARAFLTFPTIDSVNLRANYMTIMEAVADQLEHNPELTVIELVGKADAPKLESSLVYFEYISRTMEPPDRAVHAACLWALKQFKEAEQRQFG